jgi:hypothetical protein
LVYWDVAVASGKSMPPAQLYGLGAVNAPNDRLNAQRIRFVGGCRFSPPEFGLALIVDAGDAIPIFGHGPSYPDHPHGYFNNL